MTGIERIAAERKRQIEGEGFTPEYDDRYVLGQLSRAAAAYALYGACGLPGGPSFVESIFPAGWAPGWWKPSRDPVRNLEKAGALIAAEIDRLERLRRGARPEVLVEVNLDKRVCCKCGKYINENLAVLLANTRLWGKPEVVCGECLSGQEDGMKGHGGLRGFLVLGACWRVICRVLFSAGS